MIYTEKYYTQNNAETFAFSRERGFFFYRLYLQYQRSPLHSGSFLPMRMKLFLSLFENKSCVIDALSGVSKEGACLTVLCSSFVRPEQFASSIRKMVPLSVVEQVDDIQAFRIMENLALHSNDLGILPKVDTIHSIASTRELLLALLLEYRGLICETNLTLDSRMTMIQHSFSSVQQFLSPFLFYEKSGDLYAVPSFMVSQLVANHCGYDLIIQDLWGGGTEFADNVQFCKNVDMISLELKAKKERGYYHALGDGQQFILFVPSLVSEKNASLQLNSDSDVATPVLRYKIV